MLIRFVEQVTGLALLTSILVDMPEPHTETFRNTVALDIDTWSGQTGDALELLVRLFPDGRRTRTD